MKDWLKRKLRHHRWPHSRYSSGYHQWQATTIHSHGARLWVCTRCEAKVYSWPPHMPPILRVGETYDWGVWRRTDGVSL